MLNTVKTIILLSVVALAESVSARTTFEQFANELIDNAHRSVGFQGTVLVGNTESVIYQRSVGFADQEEKIALTAQYRFAPGSIVKEFSTVILMQLEADGKIHFDDNITQYIDGLPNWAAGISIEQLLTHTSGLGEMRYARGLDTEAVFEQIQAIKKLKHPPGEGFSYGNFVTVLRALIIEKVTGMDFKRYVETSLFKSAKMRSAVAPDGIHEKIDFMAYGAKPLAIDGVTAYLTAHDLHQWEKALWNTSLISNEALISAITTPSQGGANRAYYDFGFYQTDDSGRITALWHDGTYPTHFTLKFHDIKNGLIIILLSRDGRRATLQELRLKLSQRLVPEDKHDLLAE